MADNLLYLDDDFAVWDGPEEVVLNSRQIEGNRDVYFDSALRLPVTLKEAAASGGFYTTRDVTWVLPGKLLGVEALAPKPGDIITDAKGVEWTVIDLSYSELTTDYKLTCKALAILFALREVASILSPLNQQDAALTRVPVWTLKEIGIPARFQEVTAAPVDERGRRLVKKTYQVFVGRRVEMTHEDLIEDRHGNRYKFLSSETPDRIDLLQVLTVQRMSDE